ncbi:helix-turn-helix domain-containing protein (plasmid) [Tistrella mobilis]|uniref:helix-turn-helix domain-containing protein n=1 Tax=Tistrella mobilis TaxID=171437 RepID=UPI00355822E0
MSATRARYARVKSPPPLATTPRTVTDIAHATGFCDASHLINMFRGAFGLSPAEYRRVGTPVRVSSFG